MRIKRLQIRVRERGSVLLTSLIILTIVSIAVVGTLQMSMYQLRAEYQRWHFDEAYRHAENSLHWAAQLIADSPEGGASAPFIGNYSVGDDSFTLDYMHNLAEETNTAFENAWVTIQSPPNSPNPNAYLVTASAKVGIKVRTIQALINKNPPAEVMDYEYFLNNWGWWWGGGIIGWGDNRANFDFDFRGFPMVNGAVFANGSVTDGGTPVDPLAGDSPFGGYAGSSPVEYVHTGVPRSEMPNLADFSYYERLAVEEEGALWVGGEKMVDAVHANPEQPGIFLEGTEQAPIRIEGVVVIPGDVVIKGKITGMGTLYVGGNLYVAGEVTYMNGPDFSTPPGGLPIEGQDQWVLDAVNEQKDLAVFAVRESIFSGNVNGLDWLFRCYYPPAFGLRNVGDESNLGADGIADTPDDGIPYLDTNGDGEPDSAWFDADGDGVIDDNYDYDEDIRMTRSRAEQIFNYPTQEGNPLNYRSVAEREMSILQGIYYTNHALALRSPESEFVLCGSVICRDEAIIFRRTVDFRYDPRVHSRYVNDPGRYVNLHLPRAQLVRIDSMQEIEPVEGFY